MSTLIGLNGWALVVTDVVVMALVLGLQRWIRRNAPNRPGRANARLVSSVVLLGGIVVAGNVIHLLMHRPGYLTTTEIAMVALLVAMLVPLRRAQARYGASGGSGIADVPGTTVTGLAADEAVPDNTGPVRADHGGRHDNGSHDSGKHDSGRQRDHGD